MSTATASQGTLTSCQSSALDVLQREGNVFLTGAAGTGKSWLLDRYLAGKSSEDFPVVASTGAAAVIVGGRTFHSFFGLGILEGGVQATIARALKSRKLLHRLRCACCVIMDEVSMLSGATMQAADIVSRLARGIDKPWGGLRIIAVGDFAQLPPVTPGNIQKDWAFRHQVWRDSDFQPALLSTVMRTQDIDFLRILNYVRQGTVNDEVRDFLNERMIPLPEGGEGTRLYPHRAQAEQYNLRRLEQIPREVRAYRTDYSGEDRYVETAKKAVPIPDVLLLKQDALVMMRKNDPFEMRYVNGSLGHVRELGEDLIVVRLLNGEDVEIGKDKFTYLNGDGQEVAAAYNFPVTLAWATTIHKAQGASLDRMMVDLSQLWEPGQTYVALSRVRSAQGLAIERWNPSSIRAEPLVTAFYDSMTDAASRYVPRPLFRGPKRESEEGPETAPRKKRTSAVIRAMTIRSLLEKKLSLQSMSEECGIQPDRVVYYIEKLVSEGVSVSVSYLVDEIENLSRIRAAFAEQGIETLKGAYEALRGEVPYDTLRLVRCVMMIEAG